MKKHPLLVGSKLLELTSWEKAVPLLGTPQSTLKDVRTHYNVAVGSVVFVQGEGSEPILGIVAVENPDYSFLYIHCMSSLSNKQQAFRAFSASDL